MRAEDPGALEVWTSAGPACRLQPGLAGQAAGLDAGGAGWGQQRRFSLC